MSYEYILRKYFTLPTTINMNNIGVRNNIYGTCYGMIKYLCDKLELRDINYTMYEKNDNKNYGNVLEKIQNFINNKFERHSAQKIFLTFVLQRY